MCSFTKLNHQAELYCNVLYIGRHPLHVNHCHFSLCAAWTCWCQHWPFREWSLGYMAAVSLMQPPKHSIFLPLCSIAFVVPISPFFTFFIFFLLGRKPQNILLGPGIPSAKTKHFTSTVTFDLCESRFNAGRRSAPWMFHVPDISTTWYSLTNLLEITQLFL